MYSSIAFRLSLNFIGTIEQHVQQKGRAGRLPGEEIKAYAVDLVNGSDTLTDRCGPDLRGYYAAGLEKTCCLRRVMLACFGDVPDPSLHLTCACCGWCTQKHVCIPSWRHVRALL